METISIQPKRKHQKESKQGHRFRPVGIQVEASRVSLLEQVSGNVSIQSHRPALIPEVWLESKGFRLSAWNGKDGKLMSTNVSHAELNCRKAFVDPPMYYAAWSGRKHWHEGCCSMISMQQHVTATALRAQCGSICLTLMDTDRAGEQPLSQLWTGRAPTAQESFWCSVNLSEDSSRNM